MNRFEFERTFNECCIDGHITKSGICVMRALLSVCDFDTLTCQSSKGSQASRERIVKLSGLGRDTVTNTINHLESDGWLTVNRPATRAQISAHATNSYVLRIGQPMSRPRRDQVATQTRAGGTFIDTTTNDRVTTLLEQAAQWVANQNNYPGTLFTLDRVRSVILRGVDAQEYRDEMTAAVKAGNPSREQETTARVGDRAKRAITQEYDQERRRQEWTSRHAGQGGTTVPMQGGLAATNNTY